VVNATGVVLHTNLGRAAMAPGAASAAAQAAASYTDLELDLASGGRGQRMAGVARLLRLLSGAEDALVVNNGAAAVLLAASTLARGRQVVVSRGELVEIGGSFRVPDILAEAGVELVEVGTTNRTHPQDYEAAIGPRTGLLLKVHRSNFEQSGFVKEVALEELVEIGRRRRLPVVEDLGSATLVDLRGAGLPPESYAPARIASGADLVCFSGDKLMGGPQAGIVLGRAEAVARLRKSQMARALRLGKLGLSALDWTLRALLEGRLEEIPTLQKLTEPLERVEERARQLERRLRKVAPAGLQLGLESTRAPVGGGSLPGFSLESTAVSLSAQPGANRLAAALRAAPVPVVARIADDRVLLDARTLLPGDDVDVEAAVQSLVLD
jgi:L-seryl-tRNA(Ser) seleniumtransferase